MEKAIKREYLRQRARGLPAQPALRAARVNTRFEDLEDDFVRIVAEPEWELYDDSYIDTWGEPPHKVERLKAELHERLERDGCWVYSAEYLDPIKGWTPVDSIGGIIGGDFEGSGYDVGLKEAALNAFDAIDALTEVAS